MFQRNINGNEFLYFLREKGAKKRATRDAQSKMVTDAGHEIHFDHFRSKSQHAQMLMIPDEVNFDLSDCRIQRNQILTDRYFERQLYYIAYIPNIIKTSYKVFINLIWTPTVFFKHFFA